MVSFTPAARHSRGRRNALFLSRAGRWRTVCLWLVLGVLLSGCFATAPAPAPAPSGLVVLLSDGSPAFAGVQRELRKKYSQPMETYTLGNETAYSTVQKKIQSAPESMVVAIGLPAARVARGLTGKKVIFCQVFNYEDEELVTPWMKGVAATAPVREQFRVWKSLYPKLSRVGVITGKNLHGLMQEAQMAAGEYRIRLEHVEARSDKETIYAYKQLAPKIDGLWLVPDNRVLSGEVIRDILAHSVKEGKQVSVFGQELLSLGGLISTETSYADIAEQVLARARQAQEASGVPGDAVIPLTRAVIRINTVMAKRLNIAIPGSLRGLTHAP